MNDNFNLNDDFFEGETQLLNEEPVNQPPQQPNYNRPPYQQPMNNQPPRPAQQPYGQPVNRPPYQQPNQGYHPNQPYAQPPVNPYVQPVKNSSVPVVALVFGILGFFINPLYIVSIVAVILGIVGMSKKESNAGYAKAGLALGIVAACIQFATDILITIFSFGMGFFSFFI